MRVVFRADASREIGTGHVMRCLTLARALRARGAQVSFVSQALDGNLNAWLRSDGIPVDTDMPPDLSCDWLVVDHYGLGVEFESANRSTAARILVIDDLADRKHDCDLLLDQNLHDQMETRYDQLVPRHAQVLAGPRYALLRDEFTGARERARPRTVMSRVLVFFGGSDPTDETSKTITALKNSGLALSAQIVVGASNPRRAAIEHAASGLPHSQVHGPTSRMAELMLESDLAIGAGGATSWERCCLGLPSIVIAVAANQVPIAEALHRGGYHRYLGSHDRVSADSLSGEIRSASTHFEAFARMGQRGVDLVDGAGVRRVLVAMGVK
jgi:UDP-2,4-diacetamido-2,4,6-trideoxy-beta-L-altropyranose hydrolase